MPCGVHDHVPQIIIIMIMQYKERDLVCLVFVHIIERGECLERVSMSELQTKNGAVGNREHDQRRISFF